METYCSNNIQTFLLNYCTYPFCQNKRRAAAMGRKWGRCHCNRFSWAFQHATALLWLWGHLHSGSVGRGGMAQTGGGTDGVTAAKGPANASARPETASSKSVQDNETAPGRLHLHRCLKGGTKRKEKLPNTQKRKERRLELPVTRHVRPAHIPLPARSCCEREDRATSVPE